MDNQRSHILAKDANKNFYKHVKNFGRFEKPPQFDVRSLLPGKTDAKVSEALADYFICISREFDPLEHSNVPFTRQSDVPILECHDVAMRIKRFQNRSQWSQETFSPL